MKTKCHPFACIWLTAIVFSLACSVLTNSNAFIDGKGNFLKYKNI